MIDTLFRGFFYALIILFAFAINKIFDWIEDSIMLLKNKKALLFMVWSITIQITAMLLYLNDIQLFKTILFGSIILAFAVVIFLASHKIDNVRNGRKSVE